MLQSLLNELKNKFIWSRKGKERGSFSDILKSKSVLFISK